MDDLTQELREALSRLLAATANLEAVPGHGLELVAARENAARVLLLNRARAGRPWITSAGPATFMDRWRTLRGLPGSSRAEASLDR